MLDIHYPDNKGVFPGENKWTAVQNDDEDSADYYDFVKIGEGDISKNKTIG